MQRLIDTLGALLQLSDRTALAAAVPRLNHDLLNLQHTLRAVMPPFHDCDCCGKPGAQQYRDEEWQEFFLCNGRECIVWAAPAEQYDTTGESWEPCSYRPPAKVRRVRFDEGDEANDYADGFNEEDEEEYYEDEEWDEEGDEEV